MRAAVYARVSTSEQTTENQLCELKRFVLQRGWQLTEFVDEGVSGAKASRPALDRLVAMARRRQIDVLVVWSLDRLGRSVKHLVTLLDDLHALGVGFVSLREGLDWTTPSGRLQAQLLAIIAEFERERLRERVHAGLARARREGKRLGRPPRIITTWELERVRGMSVRQAARQLRVSASAVHRARQSRMAAQTHEAVEQHRPVAAAKGVDPANSPT
jgi:DNA invertase Pin-like site-specific DNA recombinase